MKRTNNEEKNTYNFPNIQCGFITINVNDLVNKIKDFYIKHSQTQQFIDKNNNITIEKTYASDEIIVFNDNVLHSFYLTYNQFLNIQLTKPQLDLDILAQKALDQSVKTHITNLIKAGQEGVLKINQKLLIFFNKLSEFIKFEIKYESIQDRSKLIEQIDDLNKEISNCAMQIDTLSSEINNYLKNTLPVIINSTEGSELENTDSEDAYLTGNSEYAACEYNFNS
ncbi:MAG: hypothetical protein EKK61_02880 [Rickettsiales bacterium]|nr:MAG: hypothetical protein EKK61_02880 [Rickettsiales bacterium]